MSRLITIDEDVELLVHDAGEAFSDALVRDGDFYERNILDYLRDNYPIHECILDIGANIGNHTLYFDKYLDYKSVVAFEPVPDNFNLLRENTKKAYSIWCRPEAVGEETGITHMTINRDNMGACEINPNGSLKVHQIRLNDIFVPQVTLIKLDAEWSEPGVIEGARPLLEEDQPLILIEDVNREYESILPSFYRLLSGWEEHKTYLYGASHHYA